MYRSLLNPGDIALVERMLPTSHTRAYVDALAGHLVSEMVEKHPELNKALDRWAVDRDFWVRCSALLALNSPLRKGSLSRGEGAGITRAPSLQAIALAPREQTPAVRVGVDPVWERFTCYADLMLDEKEFFIRKAIGWVLREVSKRRPRLVLEYLITPRRKGEPPRAAAVSGLTYREAAKQPPPEMRAGAEAARDQRNG